MKRYIDGLADVMKDQKRFFELPKEIQKSVYEYLNVHRKKRRMEKRKKELIEYYKLQRKLIEREIKQLTKQETKSYQSIKDLPNNYQIINIYVEKDRNSYRLDIHFCGFRKKCSLGTNLVKIQNACQKFVPNLKTKINQSNYKEIISSYMKDDLNDFIVDNGVNKFRDAKKILLNYDTNKFEYKTEIKVDTNKEDWVRKTQRIRFNSKSKKRSIVKTYSSKKTNNKSIQY